MLLTVKARNEIAHGSLPNLAQICHELNHTFHQHPPPHSALQFLPVLNKRDRIPEKEFEKLMDNPQTNHVLVQNVRMKVVLIRWEPGKQSSIYGHPKGGCVFKVLRGRLVEERYQPGKTHMPLAKSIFAKGGMAYIDDVMAYHAVGNPFNEVAISLHVYTTKFMGTLMGGMMKKNINKLIPQVFQDLKIYAETGEISDEKKARIAKLAEKQIGRK